MNVKSGAEGARVSLFVSWAHKDRRAKDALFDVLYLGSLAGLRVTVHGDFSVGVGVRWKPNILEQMARCDFALLLLSPAYVASTFIAETEIPTLLGRPGDRALPLLLKPLPLDGSRTLHGLEDLQVFTGPDGVSFLDTRGAARERFARDLETALRRRFRGE